MCVYVRSAKSQQVKAKTVCAKKQTCVYVKSAKSQQVKAKTVCAKNQT